MERERMNKDWPKFIISSLLWLALLNIAPGIVGSQTYELERLEELKERVSEISKRLYEERRRREEIERLTSEIIAIMEGMEGIDKEEIRLKKAKEDVARVIESLMKIKEGLGDIDILRDEILKLSRRIEEGEKRIEEIGKIKKEIATLTTQLSVEKEKRGKLERIGKVEIEGAKEEIHRLKEELKQEGIRKEQEVIKRERIGKEREELKKDTEGLKAELGLLTKELQREKMKREEMQEVKEEVARLARELQEERMKRKKVEGDKKELEIDIKGLKAKLDKAEGVHKEEVGMLRSEIELVTKELIEKKDVTKPAKEVLEPEKKVKKALPKKDTYGMDVLIIYASGTSSHLEVLQSYQQSLYLNTRVASISNDLIEFKALDRYDLIYPDISLLNVKNKYKIAKALKEYVKDGGSLFLEEDFCELFSLPFLGLSTVEIVDLRNQEFALPEVPYKFRKFQSLWRLSRVDFKASKKGRVHFKNLGLLNLKKGAIPSTAISLVNSGDYTLLSVNRYGKGWVLWTVNNMPFRGRYLTRFDLGYPDPKVRDFHFGYTVLNYLIRNLWLDFLAKERYGFSIQKVYGPYGRPGFSYQSYFEGEEGWKYDSMINFIKILREKRQIPSFAVTRDSIDNPSIRRDILRNIRYALRNYVPIMPHLYGNPEMTKEGEKRELTWHKETFKDLDIPWSETVGVNSHQRDIHSVPIWQPLWVKKDFGLLYDFGFDDSPYVPYGMPFLLMDKGYVYPFIHWTSNPREEVFSLPVSFDLPITYPNHPEHIGRATKRFHLPSAIKAIFLAGARRLGIDTEARDLKDIGFVFRRIISSLDQLRDRYEYNMNTQPQIAKTIINTHFTRVGAEVYKDRLVLIPDTSQVPEDKAAEYLNTLGVKIELKTPEESKGIDTDSGIYYRPEKGTLYIGVDKRTTIYLNKEPKDRFHIIRSNVPLSLKEFRDKYQIKFLSSGMQQVKIYSKRGLTLKDKEAILEKSGRYYELTYFGKPVEVVLIKVKREEINDLVRRYLLTILE